jgi:hypothetical protein
MTTDEKRIVVLKSTIESYKKIVQSMEERIEVMEKNHALDIKLYYTKNK